MGIIRPPRPLPLFSWNGKYSPSVLSFKIIHAEMASNARTAFDANLEDISSLIDYYKVAEGLADVSGQDLGEGEDVVLRSAIVLLVTFWEAYIEDLVEESLEHLVNNVASADKLPKALKQEISKELKNDRNEIAIWSLAGDGWRDVLKKRLPAMKESRNRSFNTPKTAQTREFFEKSLGIADISKSWKWHDESAEEIARALDDLIGIRGQIAHRGRISKPLNVKFVETTQKFVSGIVSKTGGRVNAEMKKITGKPLWT